MTSVYPIHKSLGADAKGGTAPPERFHFSPTHSVHQLPSGNQTWLAGKWTIYPCFSNQTLRSEWIFQPVLVYINYQRVNPTKSHQTIIFPWFSYGFPIVPTFFPRFLVGPSKAEPLAPQLARAAAGAGVPASSDPPLRCGALHVRQQRAGGCRGWLEPGAGLPGPGGGGIVGMDGGWDGMAGDFV